MSFLSEVRQLADKIDDAWDEHVDPWLDKVAAVAPKVQQVLIDVGLTRYAPWIGLLIDAVNAVERIAPLLGLHGEDKLNLAGAYVVGKIAPNMNEAAASYGGARQAVQTLIDAAKNAI